MAAQVKKYDPNQYNFEDFAKTMNQNFAIERAQNGQGGAFGVNAGVNPANPVNLGGTTNSQTLGNLDANGVGAVGVNAGGVGNLSGVNTVGQAKPLVGRDAFSGITNSFFDTLKANGKGESVQYSSPLVPKSSESTPTVHEDQTDLAEPVDTQPVDSVSEIFKKMTAGGTSKSLDKWLAELSGTYSEEDITSAYNTYLFINNPNKDTPVGDNTGVAGSGGSTLSFEDWQSAYSIDPTVEYQNAQAQLDYEFKTWMSEYGARAEQLYQMGLSNSGVSDIYGANAYTAYVQASMDLKRAEIAQQAENKRAYQEYLDGIKAQQSAVTSAAFNSYAASYTPAQEQSIRVALAAQGLSAEQVESAIAQLNNYYNSLPEDQRPDVVASNAKVNEAFKSLAASYATDTAADKDQRIRNMYAAMGWSQSEIDTLIGMLNGFAGVSGSAVNPQIVEAYTSLLSTYTKEQETNIRALYKNLGWSDQDVDELINMLNSSIDANSQTIVDKTVGTLEATANVTPETIVMSTLVDDLKGYKTQLATGEITQEQYDQYASSFSNSAVKAYEWAVKSVDNMADAYAMFGFDEAEWAEMDDAQRESAIMDSMAEYRTEGLLSAEGYNSVVKSWADSEIKIAIDTDKENGQATGLRAFGAIASMLLDWKNSGSLTENEYLEQLKNIISTSGLFVDNKIRWSTVPNADAHIRMNGMDSVGYIHDEDLISVLDKNEPKSGGSYVAYNDKIYVKRYNKYAGGYVWQPLDIGHYTLPGTGAAFSKNEREGIHELLKILYGVKPPKDTRR